ncbi:hypothetical protein CRUP_001674, partial [Coryphaenoides rupestris]
MCAHPNARSKPPLSCCGVETQCVTEGGVEIRGARRCQRPGRQPLSRACVASRSDGAHGADVAPVTETGWQRLSRSRGGLVWMSGSGGGGGGGEVIEKSSPPAPVELLPSNAGQDLAPTQSAEVDECQVNPRICGQGFCSNLAEGYTCHCHEGHRLDPAHNTCADIDECVENPSLCSRGRCKNTPGSFLCICQSGFTTDEEGTDCIAPPPPPPPPPASTHPPTHHPHPPPTPSPSPPAPPPRHPSPPPTQTLITITPPRHPSPSPHPDTHHHPPHPDTHHHHPTHPDTHHHHHHPNQNSPAQGIAVEKPAMQTYVDECQTPDLCPDGETCFNTAGSFFCRGCERGFTLTPAGDCTDVDECVNRTVCASGICFNLQGSYRRSTKSPAKVSPPSLHRSSLVGPPQQGAS